MNLFEKFRDVITNHQEELLAARNAAQFEIAERRGVEFGAWMDMKENDRFRAIVDADPEILERLANKDTHEKTIDEIANKLYPDNTNTIH